MNDFNDQAIKASIEQLTLSLDSINHWAELSKSAASHAWDEGKVTPKDVICKSIINVLTLDIEFTALFIYKDRKCGFEFYPDLVKMKVL
tara:strand:+ start:688 stop:954 length:267 start_codon:yes stop_codon:yes gene_type:complete